MAHMIFFISGTAKSLKGFIKTRLCRCRKATHAKTKILSTSLPRGFT
jgi:hypothetical protein